MYISHPFRQLHSSQVPASSAQFEELHQQPGAASDDNAPTDSEEDEDLDMDGAALGDDLQQEPEPESEQVSCLHHGTSIPFMAVPTNLRHAKLSQRRPTTLLRYARSCRMHLSWSQTLKPRLLPAQRLTPRLL